MLNVISYGIGTIVGFMLLAIFIFWLVRDITQTKHTVLRNYPIIGRMRYVLERQGEFFRQYFFAGERGAEIGGCWLNTGEGGLVRSHQAGRCDLVMQIGTAKYGIRDVHGALSKERALVLGEMPEPATQRQVNACV